MYLAQGLQIEQILNSLATLLAFAKPSSGRHVRLFFNLPRNPPSGDRLWEVPSPACS